MYYHECMNLLYIHGFASTGKTSKTKQLAEITGMQVIAPSLTHDPMVDLQLLAHIVESTNVTAVVGSSLGGFYALYLAQRYDLRVVLINPSLKPYDTLADKLGTVSIYGSDATFEWTPYHLASLRQMGRVVDRACTQSSGVTWANVLCLLATNDERLNAESTMAALPFAHHVLDSVQGHRFEDLMPYAAQIRATVTAASCYGEPELEVT